MEKPLRLDFTDHPSGSGYLAVLNGRVVGDSFATLQELLAFARCLRTPARYAGSRLDRVITEGGQLRAGDEGVIF